MRIGNMARGLFMAAALGALTAGHAMAGDTINGTLAFGANGANGGSFWNQASITNPGTFTYADGANTDSADFAGTLLTITDDVHSNANGFEMTFTDITSAFTGLTLISSNFDPSLTFHLTNGVAVFDWVGTGVTAGHLQATFNLTTGAAVPEPSTWILMIGGIGAVGVMARRAKRVAGVAAA